MDRDGFAARVSAELRAQPGIQWVEDLVTEPEPGRLTLVATGPLTAEPLAAWLGRACGCERLFFYDAIAPIVERDSIDTSVAFRAARYGKGGPDFPTAPWTGGNTTPSWTPCWRRPGPTCTISTRPTSRPACPSR